MQKNQTLFLLKFWKDIMSSLLRYSGSTLPQLLFIWGCLNFSLLFKDGFVWCRNLNWFSFSTLYILSSNCLLPHTVSDEKLHVNLIEVPCKLMWNVTSFTAFVILHLLTSWFIMCLGVSLWAYPILKLRFVD